MDCSNLLISFGLFPVSLFLLSSLAFPENETKKPSQMEKAFLVSSVNCPIRGLLGGIRPL